MDTRPRAHAPSPTTPSGRLGAPHLAARILPENAASIKVAASIGMSFEFNTVAEPGVLVAVYRDRRAAASLNVGQVQRPRAA